jgi:hypothetical protein
VAPRPRGGGGGECRLTKPNLRPTKCSGGQVAKAIRPCFSTRRIAAIAISGRGANICPNWLSTTSNEASAQGQLLRIAFGPDDVRMPGDAGVLARLPKQLGRQIQGRDPSTDSRRHDGRHTRPMVTSSTASPGLIRANLTS